MAKPLILLGGGGHAKVIAELLARLNASVIGLVDPNQAIDFQLNGLKNLGGDQVILNYQAQEIELINGLGAIPFDNQLRFKLFSQFTALGYFFPVLIDPRAIVSSSADIKPGCQILAGAIIQAGTFIAENTLINTGAIIDHDCHIDQHVHIAPGATLSGGVKLGKHVHIGTGAIVIQGISIGEHSIIGAGSVITQDVAAEQIVYPARSFQKALNREE